MSAPLTDDLIARLQGIAASMHKLYDDAPGADDVIRLERLDDFADDIDALIQAAAEALAAASRPLNADGETPAQSDAAWAEAYRVQGQELLHHIRRAEAAEAKLALAAPPPWQPIETLPPSMRDTELLFWVVPKTPEESYCNTDGDPIFGTFEPYLFKGKSKTWSSLSKATHWLALPSPPASAPQPEVAQSIASLMQFKPEPDAPTEDDVTPASAPQPTLRANRFDCSTCGQGVAVDEDGCCRTCGADAVVVLASAPAPQEEQPKR